MSNFRARSFNDGGPSEESQCNQIDNSSLKDRKGSFLLKWDEVRTFSFKWA